MKVEKKVFENILALSKQAYPREVGGILLGNPVDDFVLVPGKFSYNSIYIYLDQLPIYARKSGSFHSHPVPDARPSRADLDLFCRFGREHLIVAAPFNINSCAVFSSLGKKSELVVV